MSTKWKLFIGALNDISCPPSGKRYLENSTVFHVRKLENFNWRAGPHFMSAKWKD